MSVAEQGVSTVNNRRPTGRHGGDRPPSVGTYKQNVADISAKRKDLTSKPVGGADAQHQKTVHCQ